MSELDEQAVEAAAKALYTTWLDGPGAACMEPWSDDEDDETDWQSVARNDAITSITAYLAAADAIGRERVSAEMVNAAVEAFNAVTQQRTGKSLYGTWWPYEYLPAMKAALESALLTAAPAERGHDETGGEAMTRQRTSAEIEAGARAIYQNRSQTRWAWEELEPKQREHFLAVAQDTLAAADAAAPAVGVTVDPAVIEETIRAMEKIYAGQITMNNHAHRPWLQKRIDALRALLTAQPEPGTGEEKYRKIADAVARSVVPPDCVAVRRDDLRILLNFAVDAGEQAGIAGYAPMLTDAYDRLRALIGDE